VCFTDFEAQIRDLQQKRKNVGANDAPSADNRVGLGEEGHYDSDIYEGTAGIGRFEGYLESIPATDDQEVSFCCCHVSVNWLIDQFPNGVHICKDVKYILCIVCKVIYVVDI